jgi:hypothetical protein
MKIKAFVKWFSVKRPRPVSLIEGLRPFDVEIVEDNVGRGSANTAMRAWRAGAQSDATHVLVVEDDVVLAKGFCESLCRAVETHSAHLISPFWVRWQGKWVQHLLRAFDDAAVRGVPWVEHNINLCGVAVVLPRTAAAEFPVWCEHEIAPAAERHDDLWLKLFALATGHHVSQMVPCIVDTDPQFESTMGFPPNKDIRAANFVDDAGPIDWAKGSVCCLEDPRNLLWEQRVNLHPSGGTWRRFNLG